jgi:hypothetical protein
MERVLSLLPGEHDLCKILCVGHSSSSGSCFLNNLFKHDICCEHIGVFTWSKNVIVAYLVILLFVGKALLGTITMCVLLVAVMGFGMY